MDFQYADYFGSSRPPATSGCSTTPCSATPTLFQRADMVEAAWRVVDPILDVWALAAAASFPNYPAGTWGPKEADDLLARDGRSWRGIDC